VGDEIYSAFLFSYIFKEAFWGVNRTNIRQKSGVLLEGEFSMFASGRVSPSVAD
jgi:3-deoxy-D-manno-octulosonic acid (KDO) 8-phosphate synthase